MFNNKLGLMFNSIEKNANSYLDQMRQEDEKDNAAEVKTSLSALPNLPPLGLP